MKKSVWLEASIHYILFFFHYLTHFYCMAGDNVSDGSIPPPAICSFKSSPSPRFTEGRGDKIYICLEEGY